MQLYVLQGENQLGPYSLDEIRQRLSGGTFSPSDFAWQEGMPEWLPISQLLASAPPKVAIRQSLTTAKKAALAGVALLFLGAFSPVVSVPIVGAITFLRVGWPAYIVLLMAAASAVTVLGWRMKYLWATGGVAALVLVGTLANFLYQMHAAKVAAAAQPTGDDAFGNLGRDLGVAALEAVQLQWGCFILGLGTTLVLAGAYLSARE